MTVYPANHPIPLPILEGRSFIIIHIPRMSQAAFEFFKGQLELFRPAIVREDLPEHECVPEIDVQEPTQTKET